MNSLLRCLTHASGISCKIQRLLYIRSRANDVNNVIKDVSLILDKVYRSRKVLANIAGWHCQTILI